MLVLGEVLGTLEDIVLGSKLGTVLGLILGSTLRAVVQILVPLQPAVQLPAAGFL